MNYRYRTGLLTLALAAAMAAAAGAQQPAHQGHETKPQTKQTPASTMSMPALSGEQFVEMMKKHHQDGIQLAKLEESKGTREDVKALAAKIRQGQERELQELESAHADHAAKGGTAPRGTKPQGTSGHEGHDATMQKHHQMMEQMASESKQKLEKASGADVDQAFLQEMARHHQMALEMIAKAKLNEPALRKLSQKMAADQKRELQELKKLQSPR